jgi:hypothetical protein
VRTEIPVQERELLAGAEQRIVRAMGVLAVLGTMGLWSLLGGGWGLGFAAGAVLSLLNFRWLKSAVSLIAEGFSTPSAEPGLPADKSSRPSARRWSTMARFFLRYGLIALSGYAIFISSVISLKAFLLGLFTSVAGLMLEAGYQVIEATFSSSRGKR